MADEKKQELNTQLSYFANQYTGLMERDFLNMGCSLMIIQNNA